MYSKTLKFWADCILLVKLLTLNYWKSHWKPMYPILHHMKNSTYFLYNILVDIAPNILGLANNYAYTESVIIHSGILVDYKNKMAKDIAMKLMLFERAYSKVLLCI